MAMTDPPTYPTDAAICTLLAAGPLPTADLATRLGIPKRTARYRLVRLRQAGLVVTDSDRRHHLAAPLPPAAIAGPVPALAAPAGDLAAPVPAAPMAGPVPALAAPVGDLAAPVLAADHPEPDGSSPRQVGGWGTGTVLAVVAFGLVVAGGIAVTVAMLRMAPPPPPPVPPPAPRFGYPGDPWAGMPW